jgi:hypothetical protein
LDRVRSKQKVDKDTTIADILNIKKKLQRLYERATEVRVPMVRSRLTLKKGIHEKELHVAPSVFENLLENANKKVYQLYPKL